MTNAIGYINTIQNSQGELFTIGDIVTIKGGEIVMVINHIVQRPDHLKFLGQPDFTIHCKYEKNGEIVDGQPFNIESLRKV